MDGREPINLRETTTPTTPKNVDISRRQRHLLMAARASAQRRDMRRMSRSSSLKLDERLNEEANERNKFAKNFIKSKKNLRRGSLSGAARRKTQSAGLRKRNFTTRVFDNFEANERNKFAKNFENQQQSVHHGHASHITWSQELDDIKPPLLVNAEIKDLVQFRLLWLNYADKILDIAERHNVQVTPKSVYDCIEKYNRYYICAISNLLPEDLRGHPDDVKAETLHDLVMNSVGRQSDTHTAGLMNKLTKIQINLEGIKGKSSIHEAWIKLFKLQEMYNTEMEPKVVVKKLLGNLIPVQTRNVIRGLQDTGTQEQQLTKVNLKSFHNLLVSIANAQQIASEYGLGIAQNKDSGTGTGLTAAHLQNQKKNDPEKRWKTKKSAAAIKEKGCKHHGPGSYHGTSECYLEHPEKAPEGYDISQAKANLEAKRLRLLKQKEQTTATTTAALTKPEEDKSYDFLSDALLMTGVHTTEMHVNEEVCVYHSNLRCTHTARECCLSLTGTTKTPTLNSKTILQNSKGNTQNSSATKTSVLNLQNLKEKKTLISNSKTKISKFQTLAGDKKLAGPSLAVLERNPHTHTHDNAGVSHTTTHTNFGKSFVVASDKKIPILDSGSCSHICTDKSALCNITKSHLSGIRGVSGAVSKVEGMGRAGVLKDVMLVPTSKHQLMSVGALLDQFGGNVSFTAKEVILQDSDGSSKVIGKRSSDGLYRTTDTDFMFCPQTGSSCIGKQQISFQLLRERIDTLHRVFGHASKEKLRAMLKGNPRYGIDPINVKLLTECHACSLGKGKKAVMPKMSTTKATKFAERISADCSGRLRIASLSGKKYAFVAVDEFSGWCWVVPLASLKEIPEVLQKLFCVSLHQRNDAVVKFFRTDGGTEFTNHVVTDLLNTLNIERELTCPSSSYQNGKAERHIGSLFSTMRACLADAVLPPSFWAEALCYACYTHNRTPGPKVLTPFELRYNKSPVITHMRPFGCPCVPVMKIGTSHRPDKSRSVGPESVMVGYGYVTGQKGYRAYLIKQRKVITTPNLTFSDFDTGVRKRTGQLSVKLHSVDDFIPSTEGGILIDELKDQQKDDTREQKDDIHEQKDDIHEQKDDFHEQKVDDTKIVPSFAPNTGQLTNAPNKNTGQLTNTPNKIDQINTADVKLDDANLVPRNFEVAEKDSTTIVSIKDKNNSVSSNKSTPNTPVSGKGYYYTKDSPTPALYDVSEDPMDNVQNSRATRSGKTFSTTPLISDCAPTYLAALAVVSHDLASAHIVPKHYKQAMASKDRKNWRSAMDRELSALREMNCYDLIDISKVPEGCNVIGYIWVYKIKQKADGTILIYKARICVDGSRQIYGVDYEETFAPVANASTIRLVFAHAAHNGNILRQYDIKLAFISAELPNPVYMRSPVGAGEPTGSVWRLKRSLYGLKQAPRLFNAKLNKVLLSTGWNRCTHDPCLYFQHSKEGVSLLVIVVDDLALDTPSKEIADKFDRDMGKYFSLKSLGQPSYMIGMHIMYKPNAIMISQERYLEDVGKKFQQDLVKIKPTKTPMKANVHMVIGGTTQQNSSPTIDVTKYRSLVGSLMYAVVTRPDIAAPVSMCARFLSQPTEAHYKQALGVLKYLLCTATLTLEYKRTPKPTLSCYVDASWAEERDRRRSRYGYAIYYGNALICWRSKLHACICLSTAEAEYVGLTEACKDVMWLRHMLNEIGDVQNKSTVVYEDNVACMKMATNTVVSGRNKHMQLKMSYVRERVEAGDIVLQYTGTSNQVADLLTKNLAWPTFQRFRSRLFSPMEV